MAPDDHPGFLRERSRLRGVARKGDAGGAASPLEIAPQSWILERTRSAVGQGVTVSGKLIFGEPVRIEGYFRGEVISSMLVVIAEGGTVEGRVTADKLVVLGELRGHVVGSTRVYFGPHARVHGDVVAQNLTICEGAYFSGTVSMAGLRRGETQNAG